MMTAQGALLCPVLYPHRCAAREFGLTQVPAALEEHSSAERPPGARREGAIEVPPGLRRKLLRRVLHAFADWSAEHGTGPPRGSDTEPIEDEHDSDRVADSVSDDARPEVAACSKVQSPKHQAVNACIDDPRNALVAVADAEEARDKQ
jgi:hypothetical protein